MSAAAEWQELHFTARKDQVEPLEDWLFARGVPGNRSRPWWLLVLGGLVVLASAVLVWFTILTGHSGSASVWEAIIENTSPGQFVEP